MYNKLCIYTNNVYVKLGVY